MVVIVPTPAGRHAAGTPRTIPPAGTIGSSSLMPTPLPFPRQSSSPRRSAAAHLRDIRSDPTPKRAKTWAQAPTPDEASPDFLDTLRALYNRAVLTLMQPLMQQNDELKSKVGQVTLLTCMLTNLLACLTYLLLYLLAVDKHAREAARELVGRSSSGDAWFSGLVPGCTAYVRGHHRRGGRLAG